MAFLLASHPINIGMANCRMSRDRVRANAQVRCGRFLAAYSYLELVPVAEVRNEAAAEQLAEEATAFAVSHEADGVGIAAMGPMYVFEGYTIHEPWVIVLALAHNYERLKQVPSDETNGVGVTDIADLYARGTRASYALAS